jgi:molybdopterin-guanine dinucleotide biosynthesis protein A
VAKPFVDIPVIRGKNHSCPFLSFVAKPFVDIRGKNIRGAFDKLEMSPQFGGMSATIAHRHNGNISGLILTGGHSRRMGADKSLLIYHGKPQREHLFELLNKFCHEVFTSCREDQDVPPHLHPLSDAFQIDGPMNGILSAFAYKPDSSWLIVAVDMPYVTANTLELLLGSRDANTMATCFYNPETQLPEPLLTLWEPAAYPLLLEFTHSGKKSPREFLSTHPISMIDPPDGKVLLNFNYPHSL